jgi:anti-sigma-K factor RskA
MGDVVAELTDRVRGWHRPMAWFAGVMAVMTVASAVGLAVDDRILLGAPIWLKPLKFAVSMALYCLTWAWLYSLLVTGRRLASVVSTSVVVFLAIEYAVIVVQVVRGRPSHFNMSTPLDSALWVTMGGTIAALWIGTAILTGLVLRAPIVDPASRWGIRLGGLIALVGLALGALMTSTPAQTVPHSVGGVERMIGAHSVGVPDGGPGMPLTGWSTTGGDLRIPHFVGMHALQALPLLALLLGVLATRWYRLRPPAARTELVVVAAAAYAGLVALVTWQAERGQPLIHPDGATLTALGVLVLGTLAGGGYALRRRNGARPADESPRTAVSA